MKLSYTSCKRFQECPRKFQLYDIEGLRETTIGSALVFGQAIDVALNELVLKKEYKDVFLKAMKTFKLNGVDEDLRTTNKVNFFISDIDTSLLSNQEKYDDLLATYRDKRKTGDVSKELQLEFNNMAIDCLIARGLLMLEAYKENILPQFKRVLEVQKFFSIDNGDDARLIGFIDLVAELHDGTIVIFDNKTTKDPYDKDSVKTSEQLATYYEAMHAKYPTAKSGYIAIQKKVYKKEPKIKIQVIIDNISEEFLQKTFDNYDDTMVEIKRGKFEPNWKSCKDERGFPCLFYKLCHENSTEGLVKPERKKKSE